MNGNSTPGKESVFNFNINADLACVIVIFGGTGHLTRRKLLPALYNLHHEGMLPGNFAVVAAGRRDNFIFCI